MRRASPCWVGFEPAADALRAVAIDRTGPIAAAEILRTEPGDTLGYHDLRRLANALERQGVRATTPWVACPLEKSVVAAVLELPPRTSGAPIDMLAAAELARDRRVGEVRIATIDLPKTPRFKGQGAEYLAVGGGHDAILDLVERCESVGIRIETVDTPATALARLAGRGVRLIAEMLTETYRLHVSVHGRPVFSHVVAARLGTPSSVQLPEEVDRCAAYLTGRGSDVDIESILLTGPGARESKSVDAVRNEFNTPVETWHGGQWSESAQIIADPAFAQASALATWSRVGSGRAAA